ncbi:MAG: hypothetical protein IJR59_03100, partial [Firmicutes bacterium]|nr:hypothetical protein [Bacillota bacterium]
FELISVSLDMLNKHFRQNRGKGFSLVELVVLAILMVLLSILIPNVIGYVQKAAKMSSINTARVMVNGMEVSLIEHANDGTLYLNKTYKSTYYNNGKGVPLRFFDKLYVKKGSN